MVIKNTDAGIIRLSCHRKRAANENSDKAAKNTIARELCRRHVSQHGVPASLALVHVSQLWVGGGVIAFG